MKRQVPIYAGKQAVCSLCKEDIFDEVIEYFALDTETWQQVKQTVCKSCDDGLTGNTVNKVFDDSK